MESLLQQLLSLSGHSVVPYFMSSMALPSAGMFLNLSNSPLFALDKEQQEFVSKDYIYIYRLQSFRIAVNYHSSCVCTVKFILCGLALKQLQNMVIQWEKISLTNSKLNTVCPKTVRNDTLGGGLRLVT